MEGTGRDCVTLVGWPGAGSVNEGEWPGGTWPRGVGMSTVRATTRSMGISLVGLIISSFDPNRGSHLLFSAQPL